MNARTLNAVLNTAIILILITGAYLALFTGCQRFSPLITCNEIPIALLAVSWIMLWIIKSVVSSNILASTAVRTRRMLIDVSGKWQLVYLCALFITTVFTAVLMHTTAKNHGLQLQLFHEKNGTDEYPFKTINCQNIERQVIKLKRAMPAHGKTSAQVETYLWIPESTTCTFRLKTSKKLELFIDKTPIINTYILDKPVRVYESDDMSMERGFHRIRAVYTDFREIGEIVLMWDEGTGEGYRVIPAGLLYFQRPSPDYLRYDFFAQRLVSIVRLFWSAVLFHVIYCGMGLLGKRERRCITYAIVLILLYVKRDLILGYCSGFGVAWPGIIMDQVFCSEIVFSAGIFLIIRFMIGNTAGDRLERYAHFFNRRIIIWVVGLLAVVYSLWIHAHVYERFPVVNGDEHAYQFQAELFASGKIRERAHPLPEFFPYEFMIYREGYVSGIYAPGQPILLALGVYMGRVMLVPALLFGGTVVLTGIFCSRVFSVGYGIAAAFLVFLSPQVSFIYSTRLSHSGSTFFLLLSFFLLYAYANGRNRPALIFSGMSAALACMCRPATAAAYLGIPLVLFIAYEWRKKDRHIMSVLIMYGVGALPLILFFLYFNHVVTGNYFTIPYQAYNPKSTLGYSDERGISREGDLILGRGERIEFTLDQGIRNTFENIISFNEFMFGWRFSLFMPLMFFIFARRRLFEWMCIGAVAGIIAVYATFWSKGIHIAGPIYYTDTIPLLAIASSGFLHLIRLKWNESATRLALVPAMLVLIIYSVVVFIPRTMKDLNAFVDFTSFNLRNIQRNVQEPAIVFARYITETIDRYPHNAAVNPPDIFYAEHLTVKQDRKLMRFYPGRKGIWQRQNGTYKGYFEAEQEDMVSFPAEDYCETGMIVNDAAARDGASMRIPPGEWSSPVSQNRTPGSYMIVLRMRAEQSTQPPARFEFDVSDYEGTTLLNVSGTCPSSYREYRFPLQLKTRTVLLMKVRSTGDIPLLLDDITVLSIIG